MEADAVTDIGTKVSRLIPRRWQRFCTTLQPTPNCVMPLKGNSLDAGAQSRISGRAAESIPEAGCVRDETVTVVLRFQAARRFSAKQLAASCNDGGEVSADCEGSLFWASLYGPPVAFSQTKRACSSAFDTYEAHGTADSQNQCSRHSGPSRFESAANGRTSMAPSNDVKSVQALLVSPKFGFRAILPTCTCCCRTRQTRDRDPRSDAEISGG